MRTASGTSPMYLSENMGAINVASRLVEGQIRTIRGRLDQVLQIEINITDPTVPWVVRHGLLVGGFGTESSSTAVRHCPPSKEGHTEEKWPRWVSRSSGKDQASRNRSSDAAGVLEDCLQSEEVGRKPHRKRRRSAHCQILTTSTFSALLELAGGQRIGWYFVGNDAKDNDVEAAEVPSQIHHAGNGAETRSLSCVQVVSRLAWRTLECVQIEVRAQLGGRRVNRGNNRGGEECEASQLERTDDGESVANPTSEWDIGKFE